MPVNPLDGFQPTPTAPERAQPEHGRPAGGDGPADRPAAGAGAAEMNLRALADGLGVDPEELLAHLAATATATGGAAHPAVPPAPDGATGTTPPAPDDAAGAPPSPAANAAAALLNRGSAANAWTSDLTQHRGGLLVDITV